MQWREYIRYLGVRATAVDAKKVWNNYFNNILINCYAVTKGVTMYEMQIPTSHLMRKAGGRYNFDLISNIEFRVAL